MVEKKSIEKEKKKKKKKRSKIVPGCCVFFRLFCKGSRG
jgi:mRNA deadenylase 3'-5' endonuclease subunit Ccr4